MSLTSDSKNSSAPSFSLKGFFAEEPKDIRNLYRLPENNEILSRAAKVEIGEYFGTDRLVRGNEKAF